MTNFIEGIKANKGVIIKKALIVGAAVAGLTLLGKAFSNDNDEYEDFVIDAEDIEEIEEETSTEEE